MSNGLAIREDYGTGGIRVYESRDDVRELGDRLMAMHPQAEAIGPRGMRAAAQLAILLGANPLPGVNEIHVWIDKDGRTCVNLGINYWRRKAAEWGGILYQREPSAMKGEDYAAYGIPTETVAAIAKGCRADDMLRFKAAGFKTNEIWDMCGRTGIGTMTPNEYAKKGRPSIWTALKRAETDLLRQLFPAEFSAASSRFTEIDAPVLIDTGVAERAEDFAEAEFEDGDDVLAISNQRPASFLSGPSYADGEIVDEPESTAAQPNGGKVPAAPPPDDEMVVSETSGAEFIVTVASLLDTDIDKVKERLRGLGYTAVPGTAQKRLAAYRALKAAREDWPGEQDELFGDTDTPARFVDPA